MTPRQRTGDGRRYIAGRDRETAKAARCPRYQCDTLMTPIMGANGVVTYVCEPCQRNAAGLCRGVGDVPCNNILPPDPHPNGRTRSQRKRCPSCSKKNDARRRKALYHVEPERHRAIKRKSSRRPHVKARQQRYEKAWRAQHPYAPDPYTRAYAKAYMRAYLSDPKTRAAVNDRRRARAAERRKAAVLKGEIKSLRKRDLQWLAQDGILPITTETRSSRPTTSSPTMRRKAS